MEALVALFIVLAVVLVAVTLAIRESERDRVGRFKSGTSVEGDVLKLPTTLGIELGGVEVRGFWTGSAVTVSVGIGRPPHTTSTRRYVVELSVDPVERVSTSSIELGRLCSGGFYLATKGDGTLLLRAPGFRVVGGEYEGVVGVCLDPSMVPTRTTSLEVAEGVEGARAEVVLDCGGTRGRVTWFFRAQVVRRFTYDREAGVYRVVEEYASKPRARGARLEVCGDTGRGYACVVVAEATKPNEEASGGLTYAFGRRVLVFSRRLLEYGRGGEIARELGVGVPSVLGYSPGSLRARLVLDIPLGTDVVAEAVL
jgi:hypothetical protein